MACKQCEHCHDKAFKCSRCGVNITVKLLSALSKPKSEIVLQPDTSSIHVNEAMTFYLCDKCIDRLYSFMGFKITEGEISTHIHDDFGNKLV